MKVKHIAFIVGITMLSEVLFRLGTSGSKCDYLMAGIDLSFDQIEPIFWPTMPR